MKILHSLNLDLFMIFRCFIGATWVVSSGFSFSCPYKKIEKQTRTFLVKGEKQRNYKNDGKLNEIIHTLNLDLFRDFGGVSRGRNLSGVVVISKESQHIRSPVLLPPYIVNLPRHVLTA